MNSDKTLQHTPTPWTVCGEGKCSCLTISCPDFPIATVTSGEWGDEYPAMRKVGGSIETRYEAYMERIDYGTIDPEIARANALFIVTAVNSHERLTARVAKLEAAIKKCALTGAICCDTLHQPALGSKVQKAIESLIEDETKEI